MREMRRDDLPPMLIVASEELASAKVEPYITKPPEKKEELPAEAYEEDDAHSFDKSNRADALTLNFNLPGGSLNFGSPKTTTEWSPPHADEVDKTTIIPSSSSPSSKGDSQLSTTTVTSSDTTPNADFTDENVVERTTTPLPSPPPPNIDLKHLPDMLQLFKQLAQLPVMLRSMGNGGEAVGVGHLSLGCYYLYNCVFVFMGFFFWMIFNFEINFKPLIKHYVPDPKIIVTYLKRLKQNGSITIKIPKITHKI